MISQITESKDTKTPPSLGIRGAERCNPRNEKYAWGRHNRRTSVPITPFTWHSLLWLYHKTTQFAIFSFLTLSLSADSPCPGRRKHKFSTGVWKTVLQNTNRPCGVGSHGRFVFPGGSYGSGQPEKARSQALLDLPPAVGGQAAFVQVFVQVLPQRVWQREGEAVFEGGAALGNVKQAHDRARLLLVELPGGI